MNCWCGQRATSSFLVRLGTVPANLERSSQDKSGLFPVSVCAGHAPTFPLTANVIPGATPNGKVAA